MAAPASSWWHSVRRWWQGGSRPEASPAPTARPTAPAAAEIGGWRIERLLAQGAHGRLFLGRPPGEGPPVAIKLMPLPAETPDEARDLQALFLREAEAARRLHHPDIVRVHAVGIHHGDGFVAMDLLPGRDLSHYAQPSRLLPEPVVLAIGARVAEALAHAHAHGVVHRDVKPANVVVDLPHRRVALTDFGAARITDAARTRSGMMIGTPAFMAPEQLAGVAVDGRSDLYGLGVMLFQLLTARLPYEGRTLGELLQAISRCPAMPLSALRPDLPPPLSELVARLLAHRPQERPADGEAVAAQLRAVARAWPGENSVTNGSG